MKCYGCHLAIGEVVTLYQSQRNGVISLWHPACWLELDQTTAGGPALGVYRIEETCLRPLTQEQFQDSQ